MGIAEFVLGAARAIASALSASTRFVLRRQAETKAPGQIRVTFDRAVGDPGHVIYVENRRDVRVKATAWGVMNSADTPKRPNRARVLAKDDWDPRVWPELSVWAVGPEDVSPLDRRLLRVGLSGETNARVFRTGSLVAWVELEAVGVVFSERRSGGWARSDYEPHGCKCGHDMSRHERHVPERARVRRRGLAIKHGRCLVEGCDCRRYRFDKKLTLLDVKLDGER